MLNEQLWIFTHRQKEWVFILDTIGAIDIDIQWVKIFTSIFLDRGFRKIDGTQISQMKNIAAINSDAVTYLALQDKRAGLQTLEDLSIKIEDERTRLKAVQLIMDKGIKPSRNELDLIIAAAKSTPSLFDNKEKKGLENDVL